MFEDRIDEIEEKFDAIQDRNPAIAKALGDALDRLEDGKHLAPFHVTIIENALNGEYDG